MENVAAQKKETGGTSSVVHSVWDPFWFMNEMLGWGRSVDVPSLDVKETGGAPSLDVKEPDGAPSLDVKEADGAPSLDVKETDGAYVCKFKLTLPDQADVAHAKAELDNGELTLVVPKAAAATPEPASPPPKTKTHRTKKHGRGSAAHKPRRGAAHKPLRGARSRSRRG